MFHRVVLIAPCATLDKKLKLLTEAEIVKTNIPLLKTQEEEQFSLQDNPPPPTKWEKYKTIEESDVHMVYDHSILEEIAEEQEWVIDEYGEDLCNRVCVIINDLICAGCFDLKRRNALSLMITRCRHLHVSFVLLSQYYFSIPPVICSCLTNIYFFQTNLKEKDHIFHSGFDLNMDFPTWNECISIITAKRPHSCVQINLLNPDGHRLMWEDCEYIK